MAEDGHLPPEFLGPEYLGTLFLRSGPVNWKCSAQAVRRAFKSLAKRNSIATSATNFGVELEERDKALVFAVCDSAKSRSKFSTLEILAEKKEVGGRGGRWTYSPEIDNFPEAVWRLYYFMSTDEELKEFAKWTLKAGVHRKDLGKGKYLEPEALRRAISNGDCPIPVDTVDFGRAIVLFAGLLPIDERRDLLSAALGAGCASLSEMLYCSEVNERDQADTKENEDGGQSVANDAGAPRLREPDLSTLSTTLVDRPSPAIVLALSTASDHKRDKLAEAGQLFASGIPHLIDLQNEDYERILNALHAARKAKSELDSVEREAQLQAKEWVEDAEARLGRPIQLDPTLALADHVMAAWRAKELSALYEPQMASVTSWLASLGTPISRDQLEELPKRIAVASAIDRAIIEFSDQARSFFSRSLPKHLVASWLSSLNGQEYIALLRSFGSTSPILSAILARAGLDVGGAEFASSLAEIAISIENTNSRRTLFRFVPLSSAILDGDIRLRRIAAAEHLKDILISGPMAEIMNPSTGLTDPYVVGHRVAHFVSIVTANIDYIEHFSDIVDAIKARASVNFASDQAVTFINTPSGMTGNFKRLREIARETHLAPLIVGGRLDVVAARRLVKGIEDGDIQKRVIAHFVETTIGSAKLEKQHETQLSRYLETASKLLDRAMKAEIEKLGARQSALADDLRDLVGSLSETACIGDEHWVEAELRRTLSSPSHAEVPRTLLGGTEPIARRQWSDEDVAWARLSIDLPEFYETPLPATLEVGGAMLHWACLGRHPDRVEIAGQLLQRELYKPAVELLKGVPGAEAKALRGRIEASAAPQVARLDNQLELLRKQYGQTAIDDSSSIALFKAALKARDFGPAEEQLELLELELLEAKSRELQEEADTTALARATELSRLLLKSGVSGLGPDSDVRILERRWADELDQRRPDRKHLTAVADVFGKLDTTLPEYRPYLENISSFLLRSEDPDFWLPAEHSSMLAEFLAGSIDKLRNLTAMAHILEPPARRALPVVLDAYVSFVISQVQGLQAIGKDGVADAVFERVLEFDELVRNSPDPPACVKALVEAGEISESKTVQAHSIAATPLKRSSDDPSHLFRNAIEAKSWSDLGDLSRIVRATAPDEDIQRIDEVGDFARTMLALQNGDAPAAFELLEGAARAIATTGHPVHRALSSREQVDIAYLLLKAALEVEDPGRFKTISTGARWELLLKASPDLLKSINDGARLPQASRVLEQILSGAVAFEVCERIWSGASALPDATSSRSELLKFLYERGKHEAIILLASRFDQSIKTRLEQMLDLRAVVISRPDLLPAANAIAEQVAQGARSVPFRNFVHRLPSAGQITESAIDVIVDDNVILRRFRDDEGRAVHIPFTVSARGMVPEQLQVQLFAEDDIAIAGRRGRTITLSDEILYSATDFSIDIELGPSWTDRLSAAGESAIRLRFSAKTITGENLTKDIVVPFTQEQAPSPNARHIDNETILEFYPGVGNTPAEGPNFVGRLLEIEQLHNYLVATPQPSPVLLTGMRRVGKTSLLYDFHRRHRMPGDSQVLTIYISLAEQRSAFLAKDQTVSGAFFKAITRAIAKPNFPVTDHNRIIGERLKQVLGQEKNDARVAIEQCYDADSLADSLMILSERLLSWVGSGEHRILFLIDEAESLVVPYMQGGDKRVELEQFLQSLREVSQTTANAGIVLSGSNHIAEFAREYKNAFFGSCVRIDLGGITERSEAEKIIAPYRVQPFVQFDRDAVDYAIKVCAGMPQFMWQVGAATTCRIRSGVAARADIRAAVAALVDGRQSDLPFKPYDILEPVEHMLKLQGEREQDLLWLLLRRVAVHSSLAAPEASRHIFIEQSLLEIDSKDAWNRRLRMLVDLDLLSAPQPHSYSFKVPIFGEGFRAARNAHDQAVRLQRVVL